MSTESLSKIWSIKPNSTPSPKADSNDVLLNDVLLGRCVCNDAVNLLRVVPSTEQRLRNDGIIPLYHARRNLSEQFYDLAIERGITVPPFPKISANWMDETIIDSRALNEQLLPHMPPSIRDHVNYIASLFENSDDYHWSSLVAPYTVMLDVYMGMVTMPEGGLETKSKDEPLTYKEIVGTDDSMGQYADAITGNDMAETARVLREEITRVRNEAETSGWKEEEARQISERYCAGITSYFSA